MNIRKMQIMPSPLGNARLYIETDTPIGELSEVYEKFQNGKEYKVDIKPVTKKRSLEQNARLWATIGEIAQTLYLNKEDVYHEILRKYGVYTPMRVIKEALNDLRNLYGYIEVREEREDGTVFILAYKGISIMTTEEASRVIEGAKTEAEEMGIYGEDRCSGY